jgi:signal transduction histidine kinase/ActR/RegA family two-component response regulator
MSGPDPGGTRSADRAATSPADDTLLRSVFDGMAEMAVLHEVVRDADGRPVDYRILDCNPAFTAITGIPRERARGVLASALYGIGEPPYLEAYARVATTGRSERFETYFPPMDRHFAISVTSPRPGTFATITHDITELRRTAEELQRDERRLEALHELSLKRFGKERELIDYAVEAAVQITESEIGYFHRVRLDQGAIELVAWNHAAVATCGVVPLDRTYPLAAAGIWADAIRRRRPVLHNDYQAEPTRRGLPQGHVPVQRHMSCPVLDGDRIVAIAGVANKKGAYDERDARQLHLFFDAVWRRIRRLRADEERKKLDLQVQHAQKLESLGVLAGGIAHDFNNLLSSILGNLDVALSELSPVAPGRDALEDARTSSRRAAELVRQMLAYSGKGRFVIQAVDLGELVEEMAHILQVSISKRAVLRFNFAAGLPPIQADASQVRQIVMNLIINASDAIGERSGVITITTGMMDCDRTYLAETWIDDDLADGTYEFLEVTDTGCGMDDATRARIFDPFFSTKMAGRGLGLSAVLGIVRGHRGAVKVYSEPGKGTTFKILFPLPEQPAASERPEGDMVPWRGTGRILVVDDEETVRAVARRLLQHLGFEVVTAVDGRDALEIFRGRERDFELVLLDLTMPHLGGEETYRELRRLVPGQRVLMTSGYTEHEITERFAGKGIAGFVQKPLQLSTLAEAVRSALGGPASSSLPDPPSPARGRVG